MGDSHLVRCRSWEVMTSARRRLSKLSGSCAPTSRRLQHSRVRHGGWRQSLANYMETWVFRKWGGGHSSIPRIGRPVQPALFWKFPSSVRIASLTLRIPIMTRHDLCMAEDLWLTEFWVIARPSSHQFHLSFFGKRTSTTFHGGAHAVG